MEAMPFQWFQSIPPVTRTYMACSTALSLADYLGYIRVSDFLLDPSSPFGLKQVWRILLNTAYNGTFSLDFCTKLYLFTSYSNWLETYINSPRHYLWMILVLIVMINIYSTFILNLGLIGPVLKDTLLCIWSRKHSDDEVLFLMISLKARWVPWATYLLDLSIYNRKDPKRWLSGLAGILIGHSYWFVNEELPKLHGTKSILRPVWEWEIFGLQAVKPEDEEVEGTTENHEGAQAQIAIQEHAFENPAEEEFDEPQAEPQSELLETADDQAQIGFRRETGDTLRQRD